MYVLCGSFAASRSDAFAAQYRGKIDHSDLTADDLN